MSNTADTIVTENITYCSTDDVLPGIANSEIYICPINDFTTFATPKATSVAISLEEAGSITDSHTFTAPKGFFKIDVLPETGVVEFINEGEKGAKSNTNSFAFTLAGTGKRNVGFIRKYQNRRLIILVKEKDGDIKQIGSELSPAYLTEASGTSGQKSGDVKGITMKFSDIQAFPSPVYEGTITEFTPA